MPILLGVLLVLISLAVVIYPFLRTGATAPRPAGAAEIERLHRAREDLYHQIGELQADHETGAVSADDYRTQLRELRIAAAETLRALDQVDTGHPAAEPAAAAATRRSSLELEIAALREARRRRSRAGEEH